MALIEKKSHPFFGTKMNIYSTVHFFCLDVTMWCMYKTIQCKNNNTIQGSTNANELAAKKIHIWDGNGSREFLDQRGLQHRQVGDLGPVYGYQWRHFGAKVTRKKA
jgi:dihydrofolate reductase / thymidylate synthase